VEEERRTAAMAPLSAAALAATARDQTPVLHTEEEKAAREGRACAPEVYIPSAVGYPKMPHERLVIPIGMVSGTRWRLCWIGDFGRFPFFLLILALLHKLLELLSDYD